MLREPVRAQGGGSFISSCALIPTRSHDVPDLKVLDGAGAISEQAEGHCCPETAVMNVEQC